MFLGGTRLKRFMESVEKATGSIPPSMPQQPEAAPAGQAEGAGSGEGMEGVEGIEESPALPQGPAPPREPGWNDVLAAGVSLLEKLGKTLSGAGQPAAGGLPAGLVARDHATGQSYLKLPLPDPQIMQRIVDLLGVLRGGGS